MFSDEFKWSKREEIQMGSDQRFGVPAAKAARGRREQGKYEAEEEKGKEEGRQERNKRERARQRAKASRQGAVK